MQAQIAAGSRVFHRVTGETVAFENVEEDSPFAIGIGAMFAIVAAPINPHVVADADGPHRTETAAAARLTGRTVRHKIVARTDALPIERVRNPRQFEVQAIFLPME